MSLHTPETLAMSASPESCPDEITVVTWNILLDKTRSAKDKDRTDPDFVKPQSERIGSQIETLRNLGVDLDVVGIQEAQKTAEQHNGERMARALGFGAGFWFEHNLPQPGTKKGRKGEHVGLFGNYVKNAESIELGDRRIAVATKVGDKVVSTGHLRAGLSWMGRLIQMRAWMDFLEDSPYAVATGDFNPLLAGEPAQDLLYKNGFVPATGDLITYPTPKYRDIMISPAKQKVIGSGRVLDGIFVRGLEVVDYGRFEGDSDHYGLYVKLRKAN